MMCKKSFKLLTKGNILEDNLSPVHPGEILSKDFMIPLGISQNKLSREIKVPVGRINEIVNGKRGISIDTALRLGIFFGTSMEFWINLQTQFEIESFNDAYFEIIKDEIKPMCQGGGTR